VFGFINKENANSRYQRRAPYSAHVTFALCEAIMFQTMLVQ